MSQELSKLLYKKLPDINLEKNVCVYLHVNSEAQEIFYVGIGVGRRPYCNHRSGRNSEWFDYALSIYFDHYVIILYDNLDYVQASEIERNLIAQIGRKDKGLGTLLNKTDGGSWSEKYAKLNKTRKQRQAAKQILKLEILEKIETEIITKASTKYNNENEFRAKSPYDYNIAMRFGFIDHIPFREKIKRKKLLSVEAEREFNQHVKTLEKVTKFFSFLEVS